MPTLRCDPDLIPTSLKEAVADALVNIVYANVSGVGEFGGAIYGAPPSRLMVSAFLLPKREDYDGDEVTSPIWISSHGLDLQIAATGGGVVTILPKFAVYIRVFPNEEDLKRPDCRLRTPSLTKAKQHELAAKVKAAVAARAAKEGVKSGSPRWKQMKQDEYAKVCDAEGIPPNHDWLTEEAAPPPVEEGETEAPGASDIGNALPTNAPPVVVHIDPTKDSFYEVTEAPQKWVRLEMEPPPLMLDPYGGPAAAAQAVAAHTAQIDAYVKERIQIWVSNPDPETGGKLWVFRKGETLKASECENWGKYLADMRARNNAPEVPEIVVRWDIDPGKDYTDPSRINLHIALENHSKPLQRGAEKRREHAIFQVSVDVELPQAMHRPLRLDRIEPSYRYNRYLEYPAIGYNGGIEDAGSVPDVVKLRTTWAPRFVQPRVRPLDYPGVVRRMRDLSQATDTSGLAPLVTAYRKWIETEPTRTDPTSGAQTTEEAEREKQKFEEHRKKWSAEADAIEAGIAILEESRKHWKAPGAQADPLAMPFEAWRATNEAMADLMLRKSGKDEGKWHLFQLAFILATLPSVMTRMPEWRHRFDEKRDDSVTLLYFSTGGGKSEAFFGLLAFTLFLDRLRGKVFGVTALVRYPLRLLTVNQAQRMSAMMAQAELVRLKYKYPGVPFAIGFWVGSSGTPNQHSDEGVNDIPRVNEVTDPEDKFAEKNHGYAAVRKAWRKLPTCPFCGTETGLRRQTSAQGGAIIHICQNSSCRSHDGGKNSPLPFYICDADIYAFAPSVILGTVDKLAMIGHSAVTLRKVLGMFGTAPWRDKATGRLEYPQPKALADGPEASNALALHPVYEHGFKLFHDPAPALLVQDEAHLLEESLGSFAGLFESALDALFAELATVQRNIGATDPAGNRRRAKVIAASATVADPQRQLEHLYQRHIPATQFPFPGPTLYRSFYAAPQEPAEPERSKIVEIELRARTGRFYRAIMTNGRPHTATSVSILAAFHATITQLTAKTTSEDSAQHAKARNLLVAHLSSGVTEQFLRAALIGPTLQELTPQIATLIDLHRVALTYVTNKKGGDQIQAAEAEETRKRHIALQLSYDHLEAALITGSVDQGQIDETVKRTRERPKVGAPFEDLSKLLRSIVATSAISHGVDIEELNSMFFAGLPSDVAEYIQASSRIGRTHVGFSLLIPTPQRRRDRYVIEVFDIFHRFLERMVQPAAIDRWAERAVERVLSSFFQSAVCGAISIGELISLPDDKKGSWKPLDYASNLLARYNKDKIAFENQVCTFIELAVGLKDGFVTDGKDHYQRMIKDRVRNIMVELSVGPNKNTSLREYFSDPSVGIMHRPMISLRDVDEGGTIRKGPYDDNPKGKPYLDDKEVLEVMEMIRKGTAVAGETE
jgi:hypothetical protein